MFISVILIKKMVIRIRLQGNNKEFVNQERNSEKNFDSEPI